MFVADNLCALCVHGLEEPIAFNCGHRLCRLCFERWEMTGTKVCPECKQKIWRTDGFDSPVSKDAKRIAGNEQSTAKLLPDLPLPVPHGDLLVLYHGGDPSIEAPTQSEDFCVMGCFVESTNFGRRFVYCDNCDTAFHRRTWGESAPPTQQHLQQGQSIPAMSLSLKNPVSRASLALEAETVLHRVLEIHSQLVGHAIYCKTALCGYSTCALVKKYLRQETKMSKKRKLEPSGTTDSSPAVSPSSVTSSYGAELALRQEEIERAVGLGHGCRHCVRAANLLHKHEQSCTAANCAVPYCANLKQTRRKKTSG